MKRNAEIFVVILSVALHASCITVHPDYLNVEIPPNIAPLNFDVEGSGSDEVTVTLTAPDGNTLTEKGPKVRFSPRAWRSFLAANAGQSVVGEIRAGGTSLCFTNTVSRHPISSHLTYRLIPPGYRAFKYMGIYQRDLTTFEERPLFRNRQTNRRQCVNCHTYNAGDPEQYLFQVRAVDAGTVVVSPKHGKKKIQPTLPGGYPYGVYPAWHPSGDYVAFSCNDTFQMFYLNNPGKIEVMDARSDLFLYRLSDGKVTMIEEEPTVFECFPSWSPDGKLLATSSARMPFKELPADGPAREKAVQEMCSELRYDIAVREFDEKTLTFSPRHIRLDAQKSRQSFTFPRFSPDGRWIVFVASTHGVFSIWHREAELCILDLQERKVRQIDEINSGESESYHCFSKDGHWMVFSSRRGDGVYTRPYFAAFDSARGTFSKPFLLPVEDPDAHTRRQFSYNVPELSEGPVRESPRDLRSLVEQ